MELKPCPNCKGTNLTDAKPVKLSDGTVLPRSCFVRCRDCGMNGPETEDEASAEEAWNSLPRRDEMMNVILHDITVNDKTYHITFTFVGQVTLCHFWYIHDGIRITASGEAFCNPTDQYNADTGERLAMKRACGWDNMLGWYVANYRRLWDAYRILSFTRELSPG